MSSAARAEAIDVVAGGLEKLLDLSTQADEIAEHIVDKLLETHLILRKEPRRHVAAKPLPGSALALLEEIGR